MAGDVGVDVVKHELLAHRVECAEILPDVVIDIVAREQVSRRPRLPRTSAAAMPPKRKAEDSIGPAPIWHANAHEVMPIQGGEPHHGPDRARVDVALTDIPLLLVDLACRQEPIVSSPSGDSSR